MAISNKKTAERWFLFFYDLFIYSVAFFSLSLYQQTAMLTLGEYIAASETRISRLIEFQYILSALILILSREIWRIYHQVWRYGGVQCYIRLVCSDMFAGAAYFIIQRIFLSAGISFMRTLSIFCVDLVIALSMRLVYRYVCKTTKENWLIRSLRKIILLVSNGHAEFPNISRSQKIKVAIAGAGAEGIGLAENLLTSEKSTYLPLLFIDSDNKKIGTSIQGIPVVSDEQAVQGNLQEFGIQEIIFTLTNVSIERKKELFDYYRNSGCKLKTYETPQLENASEAGRPRIRDFDIEELLFRRQVTVVDERTKAFYAGKTVLITGGGGSIGSELCRQAAQFGPKQLVILDVYENGAYDVQQELRTKYGSSLNLHVEIASVCNRVSLERVFREYHPQIVINAAAHKHVPLMEKNVIEAIENNVFGTLNTVELSEKYGVERFIMVSTDKAVNPTNVMGATKRMCEMIVQSHAALNGKTTFSATRFGNVLGSAGSVIPLFRRQIAAGGPVTVTDKRITRYFMTIPEAAQLVLISASMARNGELFVLDMGEPVKIYDLARNMILLSGMTPDTDIKIIETGLRPGEKLYEELLVKTEQLDKTDNNMIFIEKDQPLSMSEIESKLQLLREAVEANDDENAKAALHIAVPTFKKPEEVNR